MSPRLKLLSAGLLALPLVAAAAAPAGATTEPPATSEAAGTEAAGTEAAGTEAAGTEAAAAECESVDDVRLQLQWVYQAQFAGYLAAKSEGFYEARCLNVEILEGGVDIVPQTVLANGDADFAITWVPKALASREQGADIVNIAQIFQRSGTLQVSLAGSGIETPADFEGHTIGNWGFGNEYEIFAALGQAGLDPASDVELVQQNFDMVGLLDGSIDAAEAMTYNEYAQVLEAVNPDTGELYTPEDLTVVSYEEAGVGMLQDSIWADGGRLGDEEYADVATRFIAASIEGWAFCRDDVDACTDIVLDSSPILGASHQRWQMNEINKLIWPADEGVGYINEDAWNRTVEIALNTPNLEGATVLTAEPSEGAYTNDIVTAAYELLGDSVDINGADYEAIPVEEILPAEGGA